MAHTEIERKFLINKDKFDMRMMSGIDPTIINQGYLSLDPEKTVRVRTIKLVGQNACMNSGAITVKGITKGISRAEYEYAIPFADANSLLSMCHQPLVEKTRYSSWILGNFWEIDIFAGVNEGLIIAEIELTDEDEVFLLPDFIGKDVSDDNRYYNSSLILHPYTSWTHNT